MQKQVAVGAVTPRTARIWARVGQPGPVVLSVETASGTAWAQVEAIVDDALSDQTAAWSYPEDFPRARPLEPDTRYLVRLTRWGEPLGVARFSTPPGSAKLAPQRWSFGAMSCHQPFGLDATVHGGGSSMLTAAHRALSQVDARFLLMMGDQIYADYPPCRSLFDASYFASVSPPGRESLLECTRSEVRSLYQERHRQFWGQAEFQTLVSSFATYPILDDHEIVDNFGTDPAHSTPAWEAVRQGARDAIYDYQLSRVLDAPGDAFDYSFAWGQAAIYVMDIRSHRRTHDRTTEVYSERQLAKLSRFLDEQAGAKLLVLVTPIPLFYMDSAIVRTAAAMLSQGSDAHERWSHPSCVDARDRLVRHLYAQALRNPDQTILLLGGDVHTGAAYSIDFESGPCFYQLVSSAISHRESPILSKASELASSTLNEVEVAGLPSARVEQLSGISKDVSHNPFGGLNLGIVDVVEREDRLNLGFRLVSHDGEGGVRTVFDSGELPGRRR